jgi:signal transduction histidine kinase
MKKLSVLLVCVIFICVLALPAWSAGTPEDAKALVEKAIAFYKANGKEKALAEFSKPGGQFTKGDLYIFAFDPVGTIIAHGGDPKLVGQDFAGVQDPDGKYFAKEFIKIGPEGGWVDYKWMNYVTKKVDAKTTYLKRIDDVIIGCGAYK